MPRLLSVAFTLPAVESRAKTETRRLGWWKNGQPLVRPGDRLTLCRKVMGRRKGEPLERVVDVRVTSVHRERLDTITQAAVAREGFPDLTPAEFVQRFFVDAQGVPPNVDVTVLRWEYLDDRVGWPDDQGVLL